MRRRLVRDIRTVRIWALAAGLTAVAASTAPAAAAAPIADVAVQYRGWVAAEQTTSDTASTSSYLEVHSGWYADVSRTSSTADFHEDAYVYASSYIGDYCISRDHSQLSEHAGSLDGRDTAHHINPASGTATSGFPAGNREKLISFGLEIAADFPFDGVVWHCDKDQPEPSPYRLASWLGSLEAAARADPDDPPETITEARSWIPYGSTQVSYVVCMSRSTRDTDGDGLPDGVDLAPSAAAPAQELGIPGGPPRGTEGPRLPGGPSGARGTPRCPAAPADASPDLDRCHGDTRHKSRRHKAITTLPAAPDIDWYRARVTATYCVEDGQARITKMKLKPTIQNGAIPRVLRKLGFLSMNPEDPEYSSIRKGGVAQASASTTYVMCFDPVEFLDKLGLKEPIKRRMKKPLRGALAKILRRAGVTKVTPEVRKQAIKAFRKRVDHAFRKGNIRAYLKKKHVPPRIARLAEKVAKKNERKLKDWLKRWIGQTMESGRYDLAAGPAAELMVEDAFEALGRATAFCGGRAAKDSNLRMWTVRYEAARDGKTVKISKSDVYKHPILTVRKY